MDKAGSFYLADNISGRKASGSAGSRSLHYVAFVDDYTQEQASVAAVDASYLPGMQIAWDSPEICHF